MALTPYHKAFTLVELLIAVAIFSLVVGAASGIFVSALKSQKRMLATRTLLDQTSYAMEYMSRAIRMARKDVDGNCTGEAKLNYAFEGQCLKFENYKGECQHFCLDGERLKEIKIKNGSENYLTSDALKVSSFDVVLSGQHQPPTDYLQPKVTLSLEIEGEAGSGIKIQTTLSQRNPDVRY